MCEPKECIERPAKRHKSRQEGETGAIVANAHSDVHDMRAYSVYRDVTHVHEDPQIKVQRALHSITEDAQNARLVQQDAIRGRRGTSYDADAVDYELQKTHYRISRQGW